MSVLQFTETPTFDQFIEVWKKHARTYECEKNGSRMFTRTTAQQEVAMRYGYKDWQSLVFHKKKLLKILETEIDFNSQDWHVLIDALNGVMLRPGWAEKEELLRYAVENDIYNSISADAYDDPSVADLERDTYEPSASMKKLIVKIKNLRPLQAEAVFHKIAAFWDNPRLLPETLVYECKRCRRALRLPTPEEAKHLADGAPNDSQICDKCVTDEERKYMDEYCEENSIEG